MKLITAITVFSSLVNRAASECPTDLDNSVDIPDTPATFYYTIGDGVLMACLEAETDDSVGWMAVGFSGNGRMVSKSDVLNHTAAIGGWGPDVSKYDLITKGGSQAPAALQTLTDASYVNADGMSTLMFTKPLMEDGEVPIVEDGENIFIYAWGPSGGNGVHRGPSGGFHTTYGNITTGGDEVEEEAAEPATNDEVVPDAPSCPELDNSVDIPDAPATFHYTIGDGVLMACLEAETDDSVGWMAVGFSDNGRMVSKIDGLTHTAAIGGWGADVSKYDLITKKGSQAPSALQTLTDASYVKADGMSTLMFTKPLVEDGEVPISEDGENIFIYAWGPAGGFHTTYGNITTTADEVEEEAEPATNDEIVPEEAEPESLADSAAFFNNNVLAAGTMAMGFVAAILL